jgi:curved DNA-binding protein CbpA
VPDDWEVLGVRPGAPLAEVRSRWVALAKELHPDLGGGDAAAARLAEVNAAYGRLRQTAADGDPAVPGGDAGVPRGRDGQGVATAFAVDDFRPVVFEAVLLAAVDVGDVTRADEPFSLDMWVGGGSCHVELFPQAGGSVVSVDCANVDAGQVAEALAAAIAAQGLGVTVA